MAVQLAAAVVVGVGSGVGEGLCQARSATRPTRSSIGGRLASGYCERPEVLASGFSAGRLLAQYAWQVLGHQVGGHDAQH